MNVPENENVLKSVLFYPFRLIADVMSALAMDDKGLSLKKILATYGTYVAANITFTHACKENAIGFVLIWLCWVGILVGIYSISDISNAISSYKNKPDEKSNNNTDNPNP
jgi:hypothetical protein